MQGRLLASQFGFAVRGLGINLEGVSEEDARISPADGGNSIQWVVGHIVSYRQVVLSLLGEAPVWPEDRSAAYGRGSSGQVPREHALPLSQLLDDLKLTTATITARLASLPDEALEAPGPNPNQTLGQRLAFLAFHESYHVGQVGLLRRLTGKPGAIR